MRRLLDFTRSGRWLTITAADSPAVRNENPDENPDARGNAAPAASDGVHASAGQARPAAASIRRLLEYTVCGHWRAAGDPPAPSHLTHAEMQRLFDDTFFGVEVSEIPAEKWREIAPLFDR